jgi:hypothetical protein
MLHVDVVMVWLWALSGEAFGGGAMLSLDQALQNVTQTILDSPDLSSECIREQSERRGYSLKNRSEREKITKEK